MAEVNVALDGKFSQNRHQKPFCYSILLKSDVQINVIDIIAEFNPQGRISEAIPIRTVTDRPYFQPEPIVLGNSMEIVPDRFKLAVSRVWKESAPSTLTKPPGNTRLPKHFRRDSADDEEELENAFQKVVGFCLRDNNTNCFLVDKNLRSKDADLIHQLVDLKLLHLARSRVTVRTRPGDIFEAYMLDFSQYSGSRRRRGLKVIEFWKTEDDLRKATLIYGGGE